MNAFTIYYLLPWKKETKTYANNDDAESINWINSILIASSMDGFDINVNEKFDLLPIFEQGVIVYLNIILDKIFFMSEAVVQELHTWLK